MVLRPALPALLAFTLGCRADTSGLEGVRVQQASLRDARMGTVAVLAGVIEGSGVLEIETPEGERLEAPIDLSGGTAGLIVNLSTEISFGASIPLELPAADLPLDGEDLLGKYRGTGAGLVVAFGVSTHTLRNRADVGIDLTRLAAGFAMYGGLQWLRLTLTDAVGAPDGDTGADDPSGDDTGADLGDTADTGG